MDYMNSMKSQNITHLLIIQKKNLDDIKTVRFGDSSFFW